MTKKVLSLLLIALMIISGTVTAFATEPGAEDTPVEEQPVSFDINDLFIDGRKVDADDISEMIQRLGVVCRTYEDGSKKYVFSNMFYLLVTCDGDVSTAFNDPAEMRALIASCGYNPDYVYFVRDDYRTEFMREHGHLGENEFVVSVVLTEEGRKLFDPDKMSTLEIMYMNALIYCGQRFITEPIQGVDPGANDDYERVFTDVNLDGTTNSKDLALLKRYVAGATQIVNLTACDVNLDGHVNSKDLAAFKRLLSNGQV